MTRRNPKDDSGDPLNWSEALGHFLSRKERDKAFAFLKSLIAGSDVSLFVDPAEQESRRRLAWLYKIGSLRSVGQGLEALAWVCLECDLRRTNTSAFGRLGGPR